MFLRLSIVFHAHVDKLLQHVSRVIALLVENALHWFLLLYVRKHLHPHLLAARHVVKLEVAEGLHPIAQEALERLVLLGAHDSYVVRAFQKITEKPRR